LSATDRETGGPNSHARKFRFALGKVEAQVRCWSGADKPSGAGRCGCRGRDGVDEPFDPASLPSIETITVNTDIRGFLQKRVPVELTRAALRRAWASDPAIRDFIGIAENQWDFNDPDALPGFGPLQQGDNLPALLARALGSGDNLAGVIPEMPVSVERSSRETADPEVVTLHQNAQQAFDASPPADNIGGPADTALGEDEVRRGDGTEAGESPGQFRPHGGALPR
jgi:hypothetical protein